MQIEEISAASLSRVICKNRLYYLSFADEERRKEPSVKRLRSLNVEFLSHMCNVLVFFFKDCAKMHLYTMRFLLILL